MSNDASNGCGCAPVAVPEVRPPSNPPGLDAIAYRVGVHGAFKAAMLRALGADPVLRRLGTRADGEPIVACLDASAGLLDVLTFYQERIANEGYLRTATERMSVLELARAIGYELRPGVAASTALAFTVTAPEPFTPPPGVDLPIVAHAVTTPPVVRIPVGTKAQSVPGQNELPRIFETVEEIEARPEWNALRARATRPALPMMDDPDLYLAGATTGLSPGDLLLLIGKERENWTGSERWDVRRVAALRVVEEAPGVPAHTVVLLDHPLGQSSPPVESPPQVHPKVHALRTTAAIFGHNAAPWATLPVSLRVGEWVPSESGTTSWVDGPFAGRKDSWAEAKFPAGTTEIFLDHTYPDIAPGSWVVLATPSYSEVFKVKEVAEVTKADYLLQAQVTRLTIEGEHIHFFSRRTTAVFGQADFLPLAERPITDPVTADIVTLAGPALSLTPGRLVAIRGERVDGSGPASEVRTIHAVFDGEFARIMFTKALDHAYVPGTVRINANVAPATHGESRTEVLGSGDGGAAFQSFTLAHKPLTYVSAATASGGRSTLEVRVDGALWTEVASLYGQDPDARVYTTRRADDGTVTVRFGDGRTGARLPTGRDNVVAAYRAGTGLGGNLGADRISLLLSRPLGVQDVINPAPAGGGDDPEQLAQARRNAPTTVTTLDRVVSLRDYEDFASSFLGIGKAKAYLGWNGERRVVRLVLASAEGLPVDPLSALYTNLSAGIDAARHPDHQVQLIPFVPRPFAVVAKVAVAPDRVAEEVLAAVRSALAGAFSFERREFGRPVTRSEIAAIVQGAPGVVGAVLTSLHRTGTPPARAEYLPAEPADLLTLTETAITLTEHTGGSL